VYELIAKQNGKSDKKTLSNLRQYRRLSLAESVFRVQVLTF